ncbi:uncharacterized protein NPIL_678221 [Nephila pilipes]|uniref:Uncharacterized protein n=1 Tax=Nephila pilipes TaxID=299642 RepID=A0A8X6IFH8_NEPPI|nr:uncharacterized protein NPIL_678221 [Nephila pilipes]
MGRPLKKLRDFPGIVKEHIRSIGFTTLASVLSELLLQEAWRNKLGWDEELPADLQLRYRRWTKRLELVKKCRIPRKILHGALETTGLHIFTDASLKCMLSVPFYAVKTEEKGKFQWFWQRLITPLELLGAVMAAGIGLTILEASSLKLIDEISCKEIERTENTMIKIIHSEWPAEIREKYNNTIHFYIEKGNSKVQTRLILSQDPENFTRLILY